MIDLKDKFDIEGVEHLRALPSEEFAESLPSIIEWTADSNWPVAKPLASLIFERLDISENEILKVLSTENHDDEWKFHLLSMWPDSLSHPSKKLIESIQRIANSPTTGEIAENASTMAQEILKRLNNS